MPNQHIYLNQPISFKKVPAEEVEALLQIIRMHYALTQMPRPVSLPLLMAHKCVKAVYEQLQTKLIRVKTKGQQHMNMLLQPEALLALYLLYRRYCENKLISPAMQSMFARLDHAVVNLSYPVRWQDYDPWPPTSPELLAELNDRRKEVEG